MVCGVSEWYVVFLTAVVWHALGVRDACLASDGATWECGIGLANLQFRGLVLPMASPVQHNKATPCQGLVSALKTQDPEGLHRAPLSQHSQKRLPEGTIQSALVTTLCARECC